MFFQKMYGLFDIFVGVDFPGNIFFQQLNPSFVNNTGRCRIIMN